MTFQRMQFLPMLMGTMVLCASVEVLAQDSGRSTRVAVCDVQQIFENLKEKVQIEADLQAMAEQLKEEEQQRGGMLRDLQHDLDLLIRDSEDYNGKIGEIERAAMELQVFRGLITQRINRERALKTGYLYRKMLDAIGSVAKESAYDLVLFKERPANFRDTKREAINTAITLRKVLWAANELDLTEQVITKMNNTFMNPGP